MSFKIRFKRLHEIKNNLSLREILSEPIFLTVSMAGLIKMISFVYIKGYIKCLNGKDNLEVF